MITPRFPRVRPEASIDPPARPTTGDSRMT
jgi:hypothetical protein